MNQAPVAVIGGGAAGMMAALWAKKSGVPVVLIEPNEKLGRKLYITGKGRCNLTNNTTPEGVLANVPRNGRFLYSAVNRFPPDQVMAYFEALGVPLKTERGGRVFPCSDRAADVIDALFYALKRAGIPQDLPVNALTKGQRRRLIETMKAFSIPLAGPRPVKEAIITAGGVKTGEVDPGTMQSKKAPGLFLAGEVLDVDAYTGGFNLQIAWCTGRAAGEGAAQYCKEETH